MQFPSGRSTKCIELAIFVSAAFCNSAPAQFQFHDPRRIHRSDVGTLAAVFDVNGDGLNDALIVEANDLIAYINHGEGRFTANHILQSAGISSLQIGDFDGDDQLDFMWLSVVSSQRKINWWSSQTELVQTIVSNSTISRICTDDVDRDGDLDLLFVEYHHYAGPLRYLQYYKNDGTGRFSSAQNIPLPGNAGNAVITADFNGDGWPDVATLSTYGDEDKFEWETQNVFVSVFENDRFGTLFPRSETSIESRSSYIGSQLVAGDFDGDSDIDMAATVDYPSLGETKGRLAVLTNDERGRSFTVLPQFTLLGQHTLLALADLDTDGRLDIVLTSGSFLVAVRNIGSEFVPVWQRPIGRRPEALIPADMTGTGHVDIMFDNVGKSPRWLHNITAYTGPELIHSELVRGRRTRIGVIGAEPNELVHFLFARGGEGYSPGQRPLGGITLDMNLPIQRIASARADEMGRAGITMRIPEDAPEGTITMQAVIRRGANGEDSVKTPFHTAPIMD